ncbi:hypothetical protein, partial [Acinetobacter baumannii]|uniref:hypothetical protein n=1 Tax=Acinetobacter baumannii TaxID=470 RepID=UPI001BC88AD7
MDDEGALLPGEHHVGIHVFLSLRQDYTAEDDISGVLVLDDVLWNNPYESQLTSGQNVTVSEADYRVLVEQD